MKETTNELINRVLGEEARKTDTGNIMENIGKTSFATGKDIQKECEQYEHLIAEEGADAFMARVRHIITGRLPDSGSPPADTGLPPS